MIEDYTQDNSNTGGYVFGYAFTRQKETTMKSRCYTMIGNIIWFVLGFFICACLKVAD